MIFLFLEGKEGRANFQTRRANSYELRAKYLYSSFIDFPLGGWGLAQRTSFGVPTSS